MATHAESVRRYAERHGVSMDEARRARQGTHGKFTATRLADRTIVETKSAQRVKSEIGKAAKEGKRVSVTVVSKDGDRRRLWQDKGRHNRGATAKYVRKQLGKTAASVKGTVAAQSAYDDGSELDEDSALDVDEIDEYQITVYD